MSTILVVDDEPAIVDMLAYNLSKAGHAPIVARDGPGALELARTWQPDLVILDLMLPGMDGLDVCRELRKHSDLPIIMLTAKDDELDRVLGLELGADDYVVKPFSVRELMARVKTVLRRAHPAAQPSQDILQAGSLRLDLARHEASWRSIPFELTSIQFDVLRLLMAHPGQVFTREELLNKVWGYDYYGDTRAVDSTIKRLRARLREIAPEQEFIHTVRDVGYKLA
ncbi:MAG: response regulator transcription factor [Dehalococcoidia bacterium]|nr:response regulator transcription factor [Dehalococcoidia bacterium]